MTPIRIDDGLRALGAGGAQGTNRVEEMGSTQFLTLLVAQLKNQDPTNPVENAEFMGQLAQFGTVAGIQELNTSFAGLASALSGGQALQSTQLIGRQVVTDSNLSSLAPVNGDSNSLLLEATLGEGATGPAMVFVQDQAGRLVYSEALQDGSAGTVFRWNGRAGDGKELTPGLYRVTAESLRDGRSGSVAVYGHQPVQSVSISARDGLVTLNLASGDTVPMAAVRSIR